MLTVDSIICKALFRKQSFELNRRLGANYAGDKGKVFSIREQFVEADVIGEPDVIAEDKLVAGHPGTGLV